MAYGDFKDLYRRSIAYKVLRDKAFSFTKNPKYDGFQRNLDSMVCKFFIWSITFCVFHKNENISNKKNSRRITSKYSRLLQIIFGVQILIYIFLQNNDIEMYSMHNEGKYVFVERFIRTLKNEIYKYKTPFSKSVYIDKLDDIVNKCNNTYHSTIKMKLVDVKSVTYIDYSKEINNKDPKFKNVRISKYKKIFAKDYTPSWSEEVFVTKKVKNTVPCTCY